MERAYYSAPVKQFISETANNELSIVLGELADRNDFDLDIQQRDAWKEEIKLLRDALCAYATLSSMGHLVLEYIIPRLCNRIDAILFLGGIVYIIEFKVGEKRYPTDATSQVMNYCLDLSYFHETSKNIILAPIVVCTKAPTAENTIEKYWENILNPSYCNNAASLVDIIIRTQHIFVNQPRIIPEAWLNGRYSPTPTIVEAARALYRNHTVKDLTKINNEAERIVREIPSPGLHLGLEGWESERTALLALDDAMPKLVANLRAAAWVHGHDTIPKPRTIRGVPLQEHPPRQAAPPRRAGAAAVSRRRRRRGRGGRRR